MSSRSALSSILQRFASPKLLPAVILAAHSFAAQGVTCVTQAQMPEAQRTQIVEAARQLAAKVQAGDSAGVKAATVPAVAANFNGIAQAVQGIAPLIKGAAITVDAVYLLDASGAGAPGTAAQTSTPAQPTPEDATEFFCGGADTAAHATFTIPQLPPGRYAFALVHATGVAKPQGISLLLQQNGPWQLAGFFPKPLIAAGHDGLWYWTEARSFAAKKQNWNAYFYYTTAAFLLRPVSFLTTGNLEKLLTEQNGVRPPGLPGTTPMMLSGNGRNYSITSLRTDDTFGGLDLVVHYSVPDNSDLPAARARTVGLMQALLAQHPELREGFHGLWVFADAPAGTPFALELPMAEIH